jgi:hypothetical protein
MLETRREAQCMEDVLFLLAVLFFFVLSFAYLALCERL